MPNGPRLKERYEQEIKPFLEPFDALIGSNSIGSDLSRNKVIVTVK